MTKEEIEVIEKFIEKSKVPFPDKIDNSEVAAVVQMIYEIWERGNEKDYLVAAVQSEEPRYGMGETYYDWECQKCGRFLAPEPATDKIPRRCPGCGQKIGGIFIKNREDNR